MIAPVEQIIIKPIAHFGFKHLNKRVTVLGYPPLIGALLVVLAVMLLIFSISFKSKILILFLIIYVPIFTWYTIKNSRAVKENRLEIITILFFEPKRKTYVDHNSIINKIKKNNDRH